MSGGVIDGMGDDPRPTPPCDTPIDAAVLADYWAECLPAAEEAAVEEHLFACDACGDRLRELTALVEGIRTLARGADLRMVVSDDYVRQARAEGLRVRQYDIPAGGTIHCTVTADDDMLIARFAADMTRAGHVDLSFCDEAGVERGRLRDVPVRQDAGAVIFQESIGFAKGSPSEVLRVRVLGMESDRERILAEYTLLHTRNIAGPASR